MIGWYLSLLSLFCWVKSFLGAEISSQFVHNETVSKVRGEVWKFLLGVLMADKCETNACVVDVCSDPQSTTKQKQTKKWKRCRETSIWVSSTQLFSLLDLMIPNWDNKHKTLSQILNIHTNNLTHTLPQHLSFDVSWTNTIFSVSCFVLRHSSAFPNDHRMWKSLSCACCICSHQQEKWLLGCCSWLFLCSCVAKRTWSFCIFWLWISQIGREVVTDFLQFTFSFQSFSSCCDLRFLSCESFCDMPMTLHFQLRGHLQHTQSFSFRRRTAGLEVWWVWFEELLACLLPLPSLLHLWGHSSRQQHAWHLHFMFVWVIPTNRTKQMIALMSTRFDLLRVFFVEIVTAILDSRVEALIELDAQTSECFCVVCQQWTVITCHKLLSSFFSQISLCWLTSRRTSQNSCCCVQQQKSVLVQTRNSDVSTIFVFLLCFQHNTQQNCCFCSNANNHSICCFCCGLNHIGDNCFVLRKVNHSCSWWGASHGVCFFE